ncbi:MAG: protein translocase subunit SecD [Actinomycetota bacterium]|nr:protein translocase subunit SecD [Actinomycetota bacterium]
MSKRGKYWLSIGFVALVIVCLYGASFGFKLKPRLGLDLKGGISLVYEAKGKKVDSGVLEKTVEKIRERVDKLGVSEPEISTQGSRNVSVLLPGIHDPERAKEIVGKTAQLQFRIVLDQKTAKEVKNDPSWKISTGDELKEDAAVVLPASKEGKSKGAYLLKLDRTIMTGEYLKKATVVYDQQTGEPKVTFELTDEGTKKFSDITTQNKDKNLAIVLDYAVESYPTIKEPITTGTGEITGSFTDKEAKDLAIVLNTGALPVELKLLTEEDVTATLGEDSLHKGMIAGIAGLIIVVFFMLAYYRVLGIVTCMGLVVFAGIMYGFISVLGEFWSLTLAGIAGLIVSVGIAADSSIVFFERLKEEVRAGKTARSSVERAYKSAFRTIIAADTVSFSAAAILYLTAVGSVRGFAFTLGMSTLFDVFISYFFTRPVTSLIAEIPAFTSRVAIGMRKLPEAGSGGDS